MVMDNADVEGSVAEFCLRCGLDEAHQGHDRHSPPADGWHVFRGPSYLDDLEDALLFVQEHPTPHIWRKNGLIIDTNPTFPEKVCEACGLHNWGGNEGGMCGGNTSVPSAQVAAHNRRASLLANADFEGGGDLDNLA